MVYDAVHAEDGLEDEGRRNEGRCAGQEHHRPEKPPELEPRIVQDAGKYDCQKKHDGYLKNQIDEDIADGIAEAFVLKEPYVVPQARKVQVVRHARLERQEKSPYHRIKVEHKDEDCGRHDEKPAGPAVF